MPELTPEQKDLESLLRITKPTIQDTVRIEKLRHMLSSEWIESKVKETGEIKFEIEFLHCGAVFNIHGCIVTKKEKYDYHWFEYDEATWKYLNKTEWYKSPRYATEQLEKSGIILEKLKVKYKEVF